MEPAETFYKVVRYDELRQGAGKLVHANFKKLAIFLHDGEVYCIQNFCPHAGAFLALGDVSGCVVRCPRHSWGFDFTDGSCKTNPRYEVKRYMTRVDEEGWVHVGLPAEDAPF